METVSRKVRGSGWLISKQASTKTNRTRRVKKGKQAKNLNIINVQ